MCEDEKLDRLLHERMDGQPAVGAGADPLVGVVGSELEGVFFGVHTDEGLDNRVVEFGQGPNHTSLVSAVETEKEARIDDDEPGGQSRISADHPHHHVEECKSAFRARQCAGDEEIRVSEGIDLSAVLADPAYARAEGGAAEQLLTQSVPYLIFADPQLRCESAKVETKNVLRLLGPLFLALEEDYIEERPRPVGGDLAVHFDMEPRLMMLWHLTQPDGLFAQSNGRASAMHRHGRLEGHSRRSLAEQVKALAEGLEVYAAGEGGNALAQAGLARRIRPKNDIVASERDFCAGLEGADLVYRDACQAVLQKAVSARDTLEHPFFVLLLPPPELRDSVQACGIVNGFAVRLAHPDTIVLTRADVGREGRVKTRAILSRGGDMGGHTNHGDAGLAIFGRTDRELVAIRVGADIASTLGQAIDSVR